MCTWETSYENPRAEQIAQTTAKNKLLWVLAYCVKYDLWVVKRLVSSNYV